MARILTGPSTSKFDGRQPFYDKSDLHKATIPSYCLYGNKRHRTRNQSSREFKIETIGLKKQGAGITLIHETRTWAKVPSSRWMSYRLLNTHSWQQRREAWIAQRKKDVVNE